ncbi:hypothetical protein D7W79_00930 [Corallococcus exercitus]|uniref:Lipoprotein n=1 Tax=Corallococcus exercitus TaxID=2316736 RepID=A0A3A8ITA0_9BACT|nr:hypothetical protein [Corallococcus exercitus]NOK34850.1 hypothetical protein [Corallococcus exercitus]RKG83074.1 hypothetical protein D7W79_00930 [Corallococcus exercitus]
MLKCIVRPLCLGAVMALASACGGALDEAGAEEPLGSTEQAVCPQGSAVAGCLDFASGGFSDASCPGGIKWSYWDCTQYKAGSGSTAQWYARCGTTQYYICGGTYTTPPNTNPPRCLKTCS